MKTEFRIITIMAILASATLFLIVQNPSETPKSLSFEKHADEIVQINEQSKKYQSIDDVQKFNESKKSMQEKLKKVSRDSLGIRISDMTMLEGQYPFLSVQDRAEKLDLNPSVVCAFEQNIPLHLARISETENFQMFAKKYSPHNLELVMMDERNDISNIHYGLIATNSKNQSASTSFHLDSCTNEITDKEPISLNCFDRNGDYSFATSNYDDVISSYSNDNFCKIELDAWRQSLYDYSQILQEKRRQSDIERMSSVVDQESQWKAFSEMNKQGKLGNIVGNMVHGGFDGQKTQEMIKAYEKQYGSLPEELLELIENRK